MGTKKEASNLVDRSSAVPLYFQLQEILKEKIELGVWKPGETIPGEEELCETHGVSRTVVRQALAILEQDRQITRTRGLGTIVAPPKVEQRAGGFSRLISNATPGGRIIILDVRQQVPTRRIQTQLQLDDGIEILRVMSLLHIRDTPVALFDSFFSVPDAGWLKKALPRQFPSSLEAPIVSNIKLTRSEVTIETSFCSKWEAEQLGLRFHGAVFVTLITEHRANGSNERPFEISRAVYRADRVQFRLELSAAGEVPQATWHLADANG